MVVRPFGGVRSRSLRRRWIVRSALAAVTAGALMGCGILGGDDRVAPESPDDSGSAQVTSQTATSGPDTVVAVVTSAPVTPSTSDTSAPTTSTETTTSTPTTAPTAGPTTSSTIAPTTASTGSSVTAVDGGCRSTATMCAGPGQQFPTLTAAVAAAGDGAIIELVPGTYHETVAVTADGVTVRSGLGGRSIIDCSGLRPAKGKACVLAVGTNLTVEDMVVTGARGPDDNEACFRNEPDTRFTVRRVECHGSNNGILGSGGSWLIEDSHFHDNGAGDGFSHNLYLSGDCSEVIFRRSTSERANGGHAFKSRCRTSTIEGSTLRDNAVGDAAEFSNGGAVTIRDTLIHQPDGSNGNIVRHGAEGCRHSGRLTFVNATITSDRSPGYIRSACGAVALDATTLPSGIEVSGP